MWNLLTHWLDAAKEEKLAERFPEYVKALERAIVVLSKAQSPQHGMGALQERQAHRRRQTAPREEAACGRVRLPSLRRLASTAECECSNGNAN
jgi:hypothetical protein